MPTFQCPGCGKPFEFTPEFISEGCTLVEKCPLCHTYVELTSDRIVVVPDRQSSKITS
jgi:endogenous inhibitor of DNA gyrase (YacG/DUF329 family)